MGGIIAQNIKDKENVILAGDFNVSPNTKTMEQVEKYLCNIFKNELTSTFNMKRKTKSGYAAAVVDMIFISKNIKVINKKSPNIDISDHLPLVSTLEI